MSAQFDIAGLRNRFLIMYVTVSCLTRESVLLARTVRRKSTDDCRASVHQPIRIRFLQIQPLLKSETPIGPGLRRRGSRPKVASMRRYGLIFKIRLIVLTIGFGQKASATTKISSSNRQRRPVPRPAHFPLAAHFLDGLVGPYTIPDPHRQQQARP